MRRLIFVRHGETAWNAERRLQGQTDVPLSNAGREQVRRIRGIVRELQPSTAISSDLRRATETAAILGYGAARLDPRLREADLGEWTGRYIAELEEEQSEAYAWWKEGRSQAPNGESWEELYERVCKALEPLLAAEGNHLVVTHGGPIRAACLRLVGLQPRHTSPLHTASVTVIEIDRVPRLWTFNFTAAHVAVDAPE